MDGQSAVDFPGERRVHIGLAVSDLRRSRAFYEALLGSPATKVRPGYVKFEPRDPSVNLSLNEVSDAKPSGGPATHYGVQVKSSRAVQEAVSRLAGAGLVTATEEKATCCYAVQDKAWATDPDGNRWEVFVVLDADAAERKDDRSSCCATGSTQEAANACC